MADDIKPRIRVPANPKKGEVIEIKTLITHPMETGQRKDSAGATIPRKIVNTMTVTFNGNAVFQAKLEPAISANPFQSFFVRVPEAGTFVFQWIDDDGSIYKAEQKVTIE